MTTGTPIYMVGAAERLTLAQLATRAGYVGVAADEQEAWEVYRRGLDRLTDNGYSVENAQAEMAAEHRAWQAAFAAMLAARRELT